MIVYKMKLLHLVLSKLELEDVASLSDLELPNVYPAYLSKEVQKKLYGCILFTDGRRFTMMYKDIVDTKLVVKYGDDNLTSNIESIISLYPTNKKIMKLCGSVQSVLYIYPSNISKNTYKEFRNDNLSVLAMLDNDLLLDGYFREFYKDGRYVVGNFLKGKMNIDWYLYNNKGGWIQHCTFDRSLILAQTVNVDHQECDTIRINWDNSRNKIVTYTKRCLKVSLTKPIDYESYFIQIYNPTQLKENIDYMKKYIQN
jgi:hypothetical protein